MGILDLYRAGSKGESSIGSRSCMWSINVNGRPSKRFLLPIICSVNILCLS